MSHIKKLHLEGFKSFAKPVDIIFTKGMNCVVGANGSGKSNLADAICFVLGRLRIKSLRAAKAAKLIYNGGKNYKPSQNAKVSIVFDNSDGIFALPEPASEVELTRIVKKDGASVYKINGQTKTRQEMLELLAQGGVDPEGFNIILQAEIHKVIEMRPDEKRQIIEEIAGISIYEARKEKSLKELNKTEDKLKTVGTILRERSAYMRNLEKEKDQAEKYEKVKQAITRDKASILWKNIEKRKKQVAKINLEIEQKQDIVKKITAKMDEFNSEIENCKSKISEIDEKITKKTGIEQEKLRETTLNLKTQLGTLNLKKDNFTDQINNIFARKTQLEDSIKNIEQEINELEETKEKTKKAPSKNAENEEQKKQEIEKTKQEIEKIKNRLEEIENKKHEFYILQNEIAKNEAKSSEKENHLTGLNSEISELRKEVNELRSELTLKKYGDSEGMRTIIERKNQHSEEHEKVMKEIEKIEKEIMHLTTKKEIHKKDFEEIINFDKCPTCKQLIRKEHKDNLSAEFKKMVFSLEKNLSSKQDNKKKLEAELQKLAKAIENTIEKARELELINEIKIEFEKKEVHLNRLSDKKEIIKEEIENLESEISEIKKKLIKPEFLETEYTENKAKLDDLQEKFLKIKVDKYEFSDRNYDMELNLKSKEIEKAKAIIKSLAQEKIELEMKLKSIASETAQKEKELEKNERDQEKIGREFKSYLEKKQNLQDLIHEHETKINEMQTKKLGAETEINDFKISKARSNAEIETIDIEFKEYNVEAGGIELVQNINIEDLTRRLKKNEAEFQKFGAVNLKALEVYDKIKAEYDEIAERVSKLEEEKTEILKIISEIDKKKKQAFMQTFRAISESFSNNFGALDMKGRTAYLELENRQDPFAGGLDITIKIAKGKYMDADSLSGGEKVLTALSLLFAIQKYKPYCFYIFDEIDPALDKRNSERFASLLRENVQSSQCIIITHNDSVINHADTLYGTSMQDGVSKIISLKV